jgi:N6-adenosine-specific RNA methylase IME4
MFEVICADPPWKFDDKLDRMKSNIKRGAEAQYSGHVMSVNDIKKLDQFIKPLSNSSNAVLALWVPSSMLQDGLAVIDAWGFKFKQTYVWVKLKKNFLKEDDANKATRVGMGRIFRQSHELCLIGTLGKPSMMLKDHSKRSVLFEQMTEFDLNIRHSQKPEGLQDALEEMYPEAKKLELFARRARPNWICLGNELSGLDVQIELQSIVDSCTISVGDHV